MNPNQLVISLLLAFTFLLPHSAAAENSMDFGEYVVHYNALATDFLPPEVARKYRITRSRNRGMVNITVLKKVLGSPGQPVHARVELLAENLVGQGRVIRLREIREGKAIYYIGEFRVANEETLSFTGRVQPRGTEELLEVHFSQGFYTN